MIIYADLTFLNNFLMTLAIIWAVSHLLELKSRWWRMMLSALIGTIYLFIVLYLQFYLVSNLFKVVLHIFLNVVTALLMIRVAFGYAGRKKYWKSVVYLYLISFITIGTTLSIFYINGGTPFQLGSQWLFIILGLLVLLIVAKYGWRLFQNYITPAQFFLPVIVCFQNKRVSLTGLIDTGNSLTDPLTKVPVLVATIQDIAPLFKQELKQVLLDLKGDNELDIMEIFNKFDLGHRVRILPFAGLGQEHGILIGFRPDLVIIDYQGEEIKLNRLIIALSKNKLSPEDEYQVLVHPQIIKLQL